MHKSIRWLLPLVALFMTASATSTPAGAAEAARHPTPDIKPRLMAIPGASSVVEIPNYDGDARLYFFDYEQPKDHRDPAAGVFKQRVSISQLGEQHPAVLVPGQGPVTAHYPNPLAGMVLSNTVTVEQRFAGSSQPGDWSKLDIRQVADDLHRVRQALKGIYPKNWLSAGGDVAGATAAYHRRFHPDDVQGTLVLGSRHDVHNDDDTAYADFLDEVATPQCAARISGFQRMALERREEVLPHFAEYARGWKLTFDLTGSLDRAYEIAVTDHTFSFWSGKSERYCSYLPTAASPAADVFRELWLTTGIHRYSDQDLRSNATHRYLEAAQTGWTTIRTPHLDDLLRYPGINNPRTFLDRGIPLPSFDRGAMADVDAWVREKSSEMVFIYGGLDPQSAERFHVGENNAASRVHVIPNSLQGGVGNLTQADQQALAADVKRWAGVA